ncbi:heptaprenyl diphosphate synthase [Ruminococcaceae bacterium FB2012]|nr:heptaprenyl diphosphate synthase [Ruminococcaceae bacterium FB2012]
MDAKRLTRLALLTALALIIFTVELQLPTLAPVPGMKLGLANIITVYAVYSFSAGETAMILVVRVLLGSLIAGNMMSLAYSMAGGMLCLAGMLLLRRVIDKKHIWVCSILGAVLHNIGQTCAAIVLMQTSTVIAYLPFLLVSGCVAGALTGMAAQLVVSRMNK